MKQKQLTLTKTQRQRIVTIMCSKKISNDFGFYPYNLLGDDQKSAILKALRHLLTYNNIRFQSQKISDYWKRIAGLDDYIIPHNKKFSK